MKQSKVISAILAVCAVFLFSLVSVSAQQQVMPQSVQDFLDKWGVPEGMRSMPTEKSIVSSGLSNYFLFIAPPETQERKWLQGTYKSNIWAGTLFFDGVPVGSGFGSYYNTPGEPWGIMWGWFYSGSISNGKWYGGIYDARHWMFFELENPATTVLYGPAIKTFVE